MSERKHEHTTQWFDKLRLNSWEVEILIVGFVLVMLLNIPDTLGLEISKTSRSLSAEGYEDYMMFISRFLSLFILQKIIYVLIINFSLYLGLRGFWVGVLGLSSVYPKGINLKNLNFNTIFNKDISKYNFNDFIVKIDNICSSIFSFSFLISFSIISFCLFILEFMALGSVIFVFGNSAVTSIILTLFFVCGVLFFVDYFCFGIIKKIKWKPFGYVFNVIDKFYKHITFIFVYDTLYYAFISNVKRRIMFLLLIGFIALFTLFDSFGLTKQTYFPNIYEYSSKNIMQSISYGDKFKNKDYYDDSLYPYHPFIQSDIITQNYLKLHIPYHSNMNKPIEQFCPEVIGIWELETGENKLVEKEERILNCINNAYNIFIDQNRIENDFIFYDYAHPLLDIKSFFMVIPLDKYRNGHHTLTINKHIPSASESITWENGVFEEEFIAGSDSITYIPFYLAR